MKEDSTGFAEGLDKSIGEKDEFLFGGMSRQKDGIVIYGIRSNCRKADLRMKIGSCV